MVHVKDEIGGQNSLHQSVVHVIQVKRANKSLNHGRREVIFGDVRHTAFSNPKQQPHHSWHSSDEIEGIFFPIARGLQHTEGVNSNTQPIHGMAFFGQGRKDGSDALRNTASGSKFGLEGVRLFSGWEFFVEQEIDDIFRSVVSEFCNGITAVVNAFVRCDEGGATGTDRHTAKTGVEVRCVDGEHGLVLRHCPSPAKVRHPSSV